MPKQARMFSMIGLTQSELRLMQALLQFIERTPDGGDVLYSVMETVGRNGDYLTDQEITSSSKTPTGRTASKVFPRTADVDDRENIPEAG